MSEFDGDLLPWPGSLAEFLLVRIAEDAEAARYKRAHAWSAAERHGPFGVERVLAECDAKRRMVEIYLGATRAQTAAHSLPEEDAIMEAVCDVTEVVSRVACQLLAEVYDGHADWREEWRSVRG